MASHINILCLYSFGARVSGVLNEFHDAIMIETDGKDIKGDFKAEMKRRIENWKPTWVGPVPHPSLVRMTGYMTKDGTHIVQN